MPNDLRFTTERFSALRDVHRGRVRFHNGLNAAGQAGYGWAEPGPPIPPSRRDTLFELWQADLIDVATSGLFVTQGHHVTLTQRGWTALQRWGFVPDTYAA